MFLSYFHELGLDRENLISNALSVKMLPKTRHLTLATNSEMKLYCEL